MCYIYTHNYYPVHVCAGGLSLICMYVQYIHYIVCDTCKNSDL